MEFESLYPPNRFDEEMYSTECTSEENIVLDVMKHYDEFVEEMTQIEAAAVPGYPTSSFCIEMVDNLQGHDGCKKSPATARVLIRRGRKWFVGQKRSMSEFHNLHCFGLFLN
ncbi:hypothetical protein SESBI_13144 [Sesbania bispinosa]|nr:hypothetical protein SESBI_13144 [Sesbania bispinosa]